MKTAATGTPVPSGVVSTALAEETSEASSENVAASASGAVAAKKDAKKVDYEIAPATQPGTYEDVCIGGLRIVPGVWYTVDSEGTLTSSEPWPDSYLFYSASQSKLTLHEFHYRVSGDSKGKDDTFAALYLPKSIRIVLEGDNELLNYSYTTFNGGWSNGIYAGNNTVTFDGSGSLKVNTMADESLKGYGVAAGRIRVEGDFIGLSVFGMSGAFNVAPEVNEAREMIVRTGTMHPDYHGGTVRDGNPYDYSVYSRHRYVLFAVGKELSEWEQVRARAYAEAYGAKADFEYQVEYEQAQAWQNFDNEVNIAMNDFNAGMEQEIINYNAELNNWQNEVDYNFEQGTSDAASQLGRLLMSGGN
ncbi:MAG: hypothetical protein J6M64_00440 [Oscillospiraceae bacterium]|nr:hypothetical protein [Oscillospiraceae bacterium]